MMRNARRVGRYNERPETELAGLDWNAMGSTDIPTCDNKTVQTEGRANNKAEYVFLNTASGPGQGALKRTTNIAA